MSDAVDVEPAGGAPRRALPRSAVAAAVGIAGGAVTVLLSSSPTWLRIALRASAAQVRLTGSSAASAAVPLALVAAAGLIALALVPAWVRRVLSAFILAAGVGVLVVAVRVLADPLDAARRSSRVTSAGDLSAAHLTAAPYACALGAGLIVVGALLAATYGGGWPGPARRYERANTPAKRSMDAWEALDGGEDPTR